MNSYIYCKDSPFQCQPLTISNLLCKTNIAKNKILNIRKTPAITGVISAKISTANNAARIAILLNAKTIETNIADFDRDIYGKSITVEFLERIRGEKRFDSLDILKKQIEKDIDYVKNKY